MPTRKKIGDLKLLQEISEYLSDIPSCLSETCIFRYVVWRKRIAIYRILLVLKRMVIFIERAG